MAIGWVDRGHTFFQDRYGEAYTENSLFVDPSQDYMLIMGYENSTHTVLRFRRKLDTCDILHDVAITNNTMNIIYMYSDEDPPHAGSLHSGSLPNIKEAWRNSRSLILTQQLKSHSPLYTEHAKTIELRNTAVDLPYGDDTLLWCQMFKIDNTLRKQHLIRYEPIFDSSWSIHYLQHMTLYECQGNSLQFEEMMREHGRQCPSGARSLSVPCNAIVSSWARGSDFMDLPTDCLLSICDYADPKSLINLSYVNRTFEDLIDYKAKHMTKNMLMVSELPESITNQRSTHNLTHMDRLKISSNWINGHYHKTMRKLRISRLHLDKDFLYATSCSYVMQFKRNYDESLYCSALDSIHHRYLTNTFSCITDSSVKNNTIFEVRSSGEAYVHEEAFSKQVPLFRYMKPILCCDFYDQLYVAAIDNNMTVWKRKERSIYPEDFDLQPMCRIQRRYMRVLCNKEVIVAGGYEHLDMMDIESLQVTSFKDGQNFIQLKNKEEKSVLGLTPQNLCLYDARAPNDAVKVYECSNLSRFDYDGINGIVVGSTADGSLKLVNLRKLNSAVSSYHTNYGAVQVNGLACDTRYVFGTWDQKVHIIDFKQTL